MNENDQNPYRVFHSPCEQLRKHLHVVLVKPENGGNVGATARALENMGIFGTFRIVGDPSTLNDESRKFAVNAQQRLDSIKYFPSLEPAIDLGPDSKPLILGTSARVGSSHRPHPTWVRPAMELAIEKLRSRQVTDIIIVFGPEASGLSNHDVDLCDWVITIPSVSSYRSLNLSQAVLLTAYEANLCLLAKPEMLLKKTKPSQRQKVVEHLMQLAEEAGFIYEQDPFKMRPKLEQIFAPIPHHIKDAKTIHGLIEQIIHSIRNGKKSPKPKFEKLAKLRATQPRSLV